MWKVRAMTAQRLTVVERLRALGRKRAVPLRPEGDNLARILDAMEDGVYIVSGNYEIEYINPVLLREFGQPEGHKCYRYFHDRTTPCSWCKNDEVFAGKSVRWQWHSPVNDKTYDLLDTPVRNRDGSISKLEIFRDITERKRTEEALVQRVEEISALNTLNTKVAENLSLEQMVKAALDGLCAHVGPDLSLFFLRDGDELLLQASKANDPKFEHKIRVVHRIGECLCGLAAKEVAPIYSLDIRRDRRCRWDECKDAGIRSFASLPLFSGENVLGVIGLASVTERNFQECSGFLETLSREIAIGLQNSLLYEQVKSNAAELKAANEELRTEITERKRAERERERLFNSLEAKNKELQSVVYVASHDLRSPLVNIHGFGEELGFSCRQLDHLLKTEVLSDEERKELKILLEQDIPENLNFVRAATGKMQALLEGLLQVSRAGSAAIEIVPLDMGKLVRQVVKAMNYQIQQDEVSVTIGELPGCMGDWPRTSQVFSNLLDNAIKYLDPQRRGLIKITGRIENQKSIYCVEDNGIGIEPRHREKVFEIFRRLDPSGAVAGEGLGLTIISRIVDRQGGNIRLESEVDEGSRFFVSLPAV